MYFHVSVRGVQYKRGVLVICAVLTAMTQPIKADQNPVRIDELKIDRSIRLVAVWGRERGACFVA